MDSQRRKQNNGHRRLNISSNTVGKTGQHLGPGPGPAGQDPGPRPAGQFHRVPKL
jgi:hypothetical protein